MKNQVVIAFISFLLFVFKIDFLTNHFTIYSFSCFVSFVPCLVNVRAEEQAEVATQTAQEIGNRNLKDQVLQPQRCRSHGLLAQGCKASRLAATVSRYPSQKLNRVIIVAGFNDNSSTVSDFANDWRFLINLIIHKFNPNVLIIPKTILSANNHFINRKLGALNNSLFRLINTFYHS